MEKIKKWINNISLIYPFKKTASITYIRTIGINNDSYKIVMYGFPVYYIYKKSKEYDILFTINERDICSDVYAIDITIDDIIRLLKTGTCNLYLCKTELGVIKEEIGGVSTIILNKDTLIHTYSRKEIQCKIINLENYVSKNIKYINPIYKISSELERIVNMEYNILNSSKESFILYEINYNFLIEIILNSERKVTCISKEFVILDIKDINQKKLIDNIFQQFSFHDWLNVFTLKKNKDSFCKHIRCDNNLSMININASYINYNVEFDVILETNPSFKFGLICIDRELLKN